MNNSEIKELSTPDIIERIYEPFFTTKNIGEGTGMGLSVVHGIVERIGGRIYVNSKPGTGTLFELLLPIIENDDTVDINTTLLQPYGKEKLLIIEDEE